jgi:hypothetical protein
MPFPKEGTVTLLPTAGVTARCHNPPTPVWVLASTIINVKVTFNRAPWEPAGTCDCR